MEDAVSLTDPISAGKFTARNIPTKVPASSVNSPRHGLRLAKMLKSDWRWQGNAKSLQCREELVA
ncbi:hypothetical protein RvY_04935 [Ramazzottius varieornatus]|uniref:Uncharacterized protein n=1 Tax=Ramazzottius varieornatus TaxID=947166 RepID=A0A1D1UWH8_RAMVA|nr:hypothetical protein RvY_04935 [Ramazzottius varieornatus]